jgi:beta-phosphoglucomutase-like phosphatase (HAD superfamily)
MLRVLVDMDGVLCDFEKQFIVKFREAYPDKEYVPLEKRTSLYLSDDYDKIHENSLVGF